jgi:hypothetical protein
MAEAEDFSSRPDLRPTQPPIQWVAENFRMGTRGNAKKGKTQREMDRWSKTEHDKPWTNRRGY